jgi:hypothetical protein
MGTYHCVLRCGTLHRSRWFGSSSVGGSRSGEGAELVENDSIARRCSNASSCDS